MAASAIRGDGAFQIVRAFLASSAPAIHVGFASILNLIVTLRFGTYAVDAIYVCYRQVTVSLNLAGLTLGASLAAATAVRVSFTAVLDAICTGSGGASCVRAGYGVLLAHA